MRRPTSMSRSDPRLAAVLALALLGLAAAPRRVSGAPRAVRGDASAGAPMTTANRTAGVAPLAVFFDAVDDVDSPAGAPNRTFAWTSGVIQPADRDGAYYAWDFGDPGSGTWSTTGLSRNTTTGYTAAHVFENPGTYTVSLSVTDTDGAVDTYVQTITVSAFAGTTYYVASDGNDGNDGLSQQTPFATFDRGFSAVNGGPNRRLLLRRGDTFTTAGVSVSAAGPGAIGAYGTGNRPVVNVTGTAGGITVRAPDWRIMDLDLVGPGTTVDQAAGVGYANAVQTVNALVLRVRATDFRVGMGNGIAPNIYSTPHDGSFWVDSEVPTSYAGNVYVGARRLAILGCDLHDSPLTHVLRVWEAYKGTISNNRLWNPGPTRHAIKLHSTTVGDGRPETRWVTVSDNLIRGTSWSVVIGAKDALTDERPTHVVFERNRFFSQPTVQIDLVVHSSHVLARNNVFDATGGRDGYTGIHVTHMGTVVPLEDDVRVLHNTIARSDVSDRFDGIVVDSGVTNVLVHGNLAVPGTAVTITGFDGTAAGAGYVETQNALTNSPGFTDIATGDFTLVAGSPEVDQADVIPTVRDDFDRTPRPLGVRFDVGAFESH